MNDYSDGVCSSSQRLQRKELPNYVGFDNIKRSESG